MASKKNKSKITLYLKITYDAAHVAPEPEVYPGCQTLEDCLRKELLWANGGEGNGDYLDVIFGTDGTKFDVYKIKHTDTEGNHTVVDTYKTARKKK